jgi:hypothetical protein
MSDKIFTLDEARRALPLVRRIADDLHADMDKIAATPSGISFLYGVVSEDDLTAEHRESLIALRQHLQSMIRELAEIGVELKGLQPILVDFPSEREGQPVMLCWAHGENDVEHWHSTEGGFPSRQRIQ